MTPDRLFLWVAFDVFVLGMLAIALGVLRRKDQPAQSESIGKKVWMK